MTRNNGPTLVAWERGTKTKAGRPYVKLAEREDEVPDRATEAARANRSPLFLERERRYPAPARSCRWSTKRAFA